MPPAVAAAPSMALAPRPTPRDRLERLAEAEAEQFALWLPVALGAGVAAWFLLPTRETWLAAMALATGLALALAVLGGGGRWTRALAWGLAALALGVALAWGRAAWVAHPVLERPAVLRIVGEVEAVEPRPADGTVRAVLRLRTTDRGASPVERVRLTLDEAKSAGVRPGAIVGLRARLMPPPPAALPGAYDFSRTAWFARLGATGTALGRVTVLRAGRPTSSLRRRLAERVRGRVGGGAGAIAATLATGDRGAIGEADADAMRRSGLAHLLSISGLHVTAVAGGTVVIVGSLLALWPWLALRITVPVVAAGAGAAAGVGYTLLTGAQVPTVRACVAALIVLGGLMVGREALTLRLVAAGALVVLLLWPETLMGPSFQLSFAAVTVIVALHRWRWVRRLVGRRPEDDRLQRAGRALTGLLLTGVAVEAALMPIALAHFHRSGLLGALANMVAIPLTTFVIMPAEALALALDTIGLGAPAWTIAEWGLRVLLALAHAVSDWPGSQILVPRVPGTALAAMVGGGLWLCLWRTRWRALGVPAILAGALLVAAAPAPDLLVTSDGREIGLRQSDGTLALLRGRGGSFVADQIGEAAGVDAEPMALSDADGARCDPDACWLEVRRGARSLALLATRSRDHLEPGGLARSCARADIVVSDRRLPGWCRPRRLKLDRPALRRAGGAILSIDPPRLLTARVGPDDHPWLARPRRRRDRPSHPRRPLA